jgi:hypothetical protein
MIRTRTRKLKRRLNTGLAVLLVFLSSTGCIYIRSYYPAPQTTRVDYADIEARDERPSLAVSFEFQTNGKSNARVTTKYLPSVVQVLNSSKQFASVGANEPDAQASFEFVMNNVANFGGAFAMGFVSGLTFGLIGTKVTDTYECTVTYRQPGRETVTKSYSTELVSTSGIIHGSVDMVEGVLARKDVSRAFDEMLEQLLLRILIDLRGQDGNVHSRFPANGTAIVATPASGIAWRIVPLGPQGEHQTLDVGGKGGRESRQRGLAANGSENSL